MNTNNATPSPKQKTRLLSNVRRTIGTNPQLTSLPSLLFDKPSNQRLNLNQIGSLEKDDLRSSTPPFRVRDEYGFLDSPPEHKTIRKIHLSSSTEDDGDLTSPTSSGSSSSSSNLSSPLSHDSLHPSIYQERRYASWFSKVTYCTNKYVEDRYIYSKSPGKKTNLLDMPSDSATDDTVHAASFFTIPSTRQDLLKDLDWFFNDEQEETITEDQLNRFFAGPCSPKPPLRSAFVEVMDFDPSAMIKFETSPPEVAKAIPESIHQFLTSLSTDLRNDPTEFSPHLSDWDRCSEENLIQAQGYDRRLHHHQQPFESQRLERAEPTPLSDLSDLPMVLKCSLARAKNVKRRKNPTTPSNVGGRTSSRSPMKKLATETYDLLQFYGLNLSDDPILDPVAPPPPPPSSSAETPPPPPIDESTIGIAL